MWNPATADTDALEGHNCRGLEDIAELGRHRGRSALGLISGKYKLRCTVSTPIVDLVLGRFKAVKFCRHNLSVKVKKRKDVDLIFPSL